MIPPEVSRHLDDELRLRLDACAAELQEELEKLAERARSSNAAGADVALAAGVLLAMASRSEPGR